MSKKTLDSNDAAAKKRQLRNGLIKLVSIILASFIGVLGVIVGIMYLTGAFDPVVIYPTGIHFENTLYEPTLTYDEDGNLIDYFYIKVLGDPDDITEKEINLSVGDSYVVTLEKTTANIGEDIKVFITTEDGKMPNGGATTITARAGGSGIYGSDTCNIFIDRPVTGIEVQTSKNNTTNSQSLYVNEVISVYEPIFYPERSKNPSKVDENQGSEIVSKVDKSYMYVLEFEFKQPGADGDVYRWVDVDNLSDPANTESNRVVKWANSQKTQIVALKEGRFRLLCHAFSTYKVQEEEITEETVEQKKVRMSVSDGYEEEQIFTVTEVNLNSIESKNYNSTSTPLDFEYKKEYKLYLRSNSSISQLATNRAYNVDIAINPQDGYGIDYTAMYDKVKDVYITTNLQNQDTIIKITGRTVVDENNVTRIYPILDNEWESFPDNQKEYYYIITVVGKSSNFAFNFHIINPNDGTELTTSVSASISEVQTTEFNFNKGPYTENDLTVSIDPTGDHTRNNMKAVIDPDSPFEVDLYDYITNLSADGREPTYDKILFYAYVSNSTETFAENLVTISEVISITTKEQTPFVLAQDRYGILIENGLLKPIGNGEVTIYAALIQTDYYGNDVQNAVTGTYAIKLASIKLSVETLLKQVRVQIRENNSNEVVEEDLNENYIYKLVLQPTYDGAPVDYKVLDRVIDLIQLSFITEEDGIAQIQVDSEFVYDAVNGYHYCLISIPSSSLQNYAKDVQCFVYYENRLIGSSPQYQINDTAVKSVKLIVDSEDKTAKTDYVYKAEVSNGSIIWREVYNDAEGKTAVGGQFGFNVAIDGLNQNYNLTSSDPTSISIYNDNGLQKLNFMKPTNGFVTITCESVENANIKDVIRIKLEESQFVFEAKNMTISNGEIYNNNDTYVETVYKDYKVNVFNLVTVKFNGEVFNNLATLRFSTATSNAILANTDGENGLSTAGDVYFIHNVSSSEYITVEIVTTFGDVLRYRFILRNNLAPTIEFKNVSNINSDASMTNQNQAVVSEYEGELYMTMVYAQGNTINVKDLIALNHQEDITKVFTNQLIQNDLRFEVATTGGRLVTINSLTGVMIYSNSGLQRVTEPSLIDVRMYEVDLIDKALGNVEGNTMTVYNYAFKVLLVPNILVETTTRTINDEDFTVYKAGKYVFLNDEFVSEYNFEEISGTVQNLEIPFANFFSVRNFRGDVIDSAVVNYSIPEDSFASLTSTGVLISPDSLYVSSLLEIDMTYTNYTTYTSSVSITINPYYAIGYNTSNTECYIKDGEDEYILIHVEQRIELYQVISILNDSTNVKKDALTYQIHQNEYINIRESTNSLSAYINGLKYSGENFAYVDVYLDGKATGFVIKVKAIENVDFINYGVNESGITAVLGDKIVIENEVEYWEAYADQSLDLNVVFIANKYTPKENRLSMIYSFHVYQPETDTYIEDTNNNYIELSSNIIIFKEVAETTKILIRARAEEYDEEDGVYPLEFIVEIQKSQGWQWIYPISDNDIHELDFDREHLLSNWNNDLIEGVSKERLENVLFTDSYVYNDINYRELQPNDTFNVSDVLQVYNITKDQQGGVVNTPLSISDMLAFVDIEFIDYDFDTSSWVISSHVTINGNVVTIKDNVSVPTLTFMVVTSENGMLDVYKLYILTKETVNSKENISIIIAYPTNSSNYYLDDTDNKYEHINLDSYSTSLNEYVNEDGDSYYGVNLTSIPEGGNGTRRISASLNSQDVTSTLRFKVYAEVLNAATNTFSPLADTYFQPVIVGSFLALTDGRAEALPEDTRITISIYNSYETDFGLYYYLWIGDDLLVNFNVNESTKELSRTVDGVTENYTYHYRNEFTYTDGNMYTIKDFVTFTRLDGTEISDENIEYYIAEASDFEIEDGNILSYGEDLTKQSTLQIVLIQDGGRFSIRRLASIEGTAIVIKCKIYLTDDKQEYSIVNYPIIVKSSGVESSNPDDTVNSQSNPYIVSYDSNNLKSASGDDSGKYTVYDLYKNEGGAVKTTFIDILSLGELVDTLGENLNVEDLVLDLDNFLLSSSHPDLVQFNQVSRSEFDVTNIDVPEWLRTKEIKILTGGRKYTFRYSDDKGIEWITIEDPLIIVNNFAYLSRSEIKEENGEFKIADNYNTTYTKSEDGKWLNDAGNELPNAYESEGYVYYNGELQEEGNIIKISNEVSYTYTSGVWSRVVTNIAIPIFNIYILRDVAQDTIVTLSIKPKWRDFEIFKVDEKGEILDEEKLSTTNLNYYIKVVPEYAVSNANASYSKNIYSYHEYDVLNKENETRFIFSRFNNQTSMYEEIDFYNDFNDENSKYKLVILSEDRTAIINDCSELLTIKGSKIIFKGVLNQEKVCIGVAYDSDLISETNDLYIYPNVYIDFYINLNFTPNDIDVLNSNGTINTESNTYSIANNVALTDIVKIKRFVDDDIASEYLTNSGINEIEILNTFTYESSKYGNNKEDILTIKNGVISVSDTFLTAESYNANIVISLRGVYLTTIYFTVQANYSFTVNNASTIVYVGQQIDLTNLGKSFIGNDGSELVGGQMTFQALEEDVEIENGMVTFQTEGDYKVLVTYKKGNGTYIGTIDFIVKSRYTVMANQDFVVSNNSIPTNVNELSSEEINLLIQDFKFYYEGELMNTPNLTSENIKLTTTGFDNIYKIEVTYQGVSAHYYMCIDNNKYYYNTNIDETYITIPGGNTVELTEMVDVTFDSNNEIVEINQSKDIEFIGLDIPENEVVNKTSYTSTLVREVEAREFLYKMQSINGDYYYGLITLNILPSFKINAIYNNPSQEITTVAVGEKINIHDQISFTIQDGLDNANLGSSLNSEVRKEYSLALFDTDGSKVNDLTDCLSDTNGDFEFKIKALNYTLLVEYKFIYEPQDGDSYILGTVYYQILVRGVDYHFVTTDTPTYELYVEGDNSNILKASDFGYFNITGDTYKFSSVGNYYEIGETKEGNYYISKSNVLYDTECDILITLTKEIDGKVYTFSTVQKFILKQTYNIDYNVLEGNVNKEFTRNVFAEYNSSISGGTTKLIDTKYYTFNENRVRDIIGLIDSVTISTLVDSVSYNYIYNISKSENGYEIICLSDDSNTNSIYDLRITVDEFDSYSLNFYTLYINQSYALDGCSVTFLIKFKAEDQTKFIDFTISYDTTSKTGEFNFKKQNLIFDKDNNSIAIKQSDFSITDVEDIKIVASTNVMQLSISGIIEYYAANNDSETTLTITAQKLYGDNVTGYIYFDLYNLQTNSYVASHNVAILIKANDIVLKVDEDNGNDFDNNLDDAKVFSNAKVVLNEFTYDDTIYKLNINYKVYDYSGNLASNEDYLITNSNSNEITFLRSPNGKNFTFVIEYVFTLIDGVELDNFKSIKFTKIYEVLTPTYELSVENYIIKDNLITLTGSELNINLLARYDTSLTIKQIITDYKFFVSGNINKDSLINSSQDNYTLNVKFKSISYSTYVRLMVQSLVDGYTVELYLDISIPSKFSADTQINLNLSNIIEVNSSNPKVTFNTQAVSVEVFDENGNTLTNVNNNLYLLNSSKTELTLKEYNYIYAVKFNATEKYNGADSYNYKYYTLIDANSKEIVNFYITKDGSTTEANGIYLEYDSPTKYNITFNKSTSMLNYTYNVDSTSNVTAEINSNVLTLTSKSKTNFTDYLTIKVLFQSICVYEREYEVYGSSEVFDYNSRSVTINIPEDYTADTYKVDLTTFSNFGYTFHDNNSDKVEVVDGVAIFDVPYLVYNVDSNGNVTIDKNHNSNSYDAIITASKAVIAESKNESNITLNFKVTTNKTKLEDDYTINKLSTKVKMLDDITVDFNNALITKNVKEVTYAGNKLNGNLLFKKLDNVNYYLTDDFSSICIYSPQANEFYCLVEQNYNNNISYYLQKFNITGAVSENKFIIEPKDLLDGFVNNNGVKVTTTLVEEVSEKYNIYNTIIDFSTDTNNFPSSIVINGETQTEVPILTYKYEIDNNGLLKAIAPQTQSFELELSNADGDTKLFRITIQNTEERDAMTNLSTAVFNDLQTNSSGVASVSDIVLSSEFIYDNNYVDVNGKLKGTLEFIGQPGAQNKLSSDGKSMTFYNKGTYNLVVKQTLTGNTVVYYVVKVIVNNVATKSDIITTTEYKFNKATNNGQEYVYTITNDNTTLQTVIDAAFGPNTYNSNFEVLSSSVDVQSNIIQFTQSDFDKYGYIHVYCSTNNSFYVVKLYRESSGVSIKLFNTLEVTQSDNTINALTGLKEIDVYNAFNALSEGVNNNITDDVLIEYIRSSFGGKKIESIKRTGNTFVIEQKGLIKNYSNTVVLRRVIKVITNTFTLKATGVFDYFKNSSIYTPISGTAGVTINNDKTISFAPVLTDTEIYIKVTSKVSSSSNDDSVNVQYVKFILLADLNSYTNLTKDFAVTSVVKGTSTELVFSDTTNFKYQLENEAGYITKYTFNETENYGYYYKYFKVTDKYGNTVTLTKVYNIISGEDVLPVVFKQNIFSVSGTDIDLSTVITVLNNGYTPTFTIKSIDANIPTGSVSINGKMLNCNFYHFYAYNVTLTAKVGSNTYDFNLILESNINKSLFNQTHLGNKESSDVITLFSNYSQTPMINTLDVTVEVKNSNGEKVSYEYSNGNINLITLENGNYIVYVSVLDDCNVIYSYNFGFTVDEATSQMLEYVTNNVVIKAGETLTLTKDGDTQANNHIGTFTLLPATIDGVELSEVVLNDLSYMTFELHYNGSELTIVDLQSVQAGHVLYDTTVQVEVEMSDGINTYIGYLNITILGDYTFENNVQDNFRVDFETDFTLSDLITVRQENTDITSTLNSLSELATTVEIVDYLSSKLSEDITYDENTQIFRVTNAASGKVYIARLIFSTNNQVKIIEIVINVNEKTYTFNFKSDIYTIYSGESVNLNDLVGQFVDSNDYMISTDITRPELSFALEDAENVPFVSLNGKRLTAYSVLENTTIRVKVSQGESYVGYLNVTILPHYEISINIDSGALIENNIIKLNVYKSVNLKPEIIDTLDSGYGNNFTIECRLNGELRSLTDGIYTFTPDNNYLGKTSTVEFIISVQYNGVVYQSITLTQQIYTYNRIMKFVGVNNTINDDIKDEDKGLDITSLFEFYYENDLENNVSISSDDYDLFFNANNGSIELNKVNKDFTYVDYNNNEIGYKIDGNKLILDTSRATSNILLSIEIVDKYTGNSVTYTCIVICA